MAEPVVEPVVDSDIRSAARMWGSSWKRYLFPAFWLIYLGQTIGGVAKRAHGLEAVAGYVIVGLFAACYLTALTMGRCGKFRPFWVLTGTAAALTVVECLIAGPDGLPFLVYLSVLLVATQQTWTVGATVVLAVLAGGLPRVVPGWGGQVQWDIALSVLLVSLAMFGFFKIIYANIALTQARAEVARLAAENERTRIARDLHDLLGHSLTTITVKAGLARRLAEHGEDERARTEIAEVEQLARRTLGDVRAAVSAQREVTLVSELATATEVLHAANIGAELPPTVAETDPELSELFGWVIREGVTNVVRHSRADHVRITLGPRWVEVCDDGHGPLGHSEAGNGLRGLRERVREAGGRLTTTATVPGFTLRAEVPPATQPAEPVGDADARVPARS